uniref:NADH dehydrogenase subunit 6 n=1 Tax=Rapana venosa TaxID=55521 RepID=B5L2G1_RAPVE|nr:NADH dehydrogenase subunit 6 [Rapana venosa]ABV66264.1 NADH dehydrogenase subunit 6 [Rapana venosa]AIM46735.1 NADH dehydrogenase subunit 6 [Rapana venosa]UYK51664.1 NADH dehydrogenase subunit 6 [Rapana venosa]
MTALIIFSMAFSSFLMLPFMSQPLSLGLVVMVSTLFMCVASAITLSSWYGYILFLIYVGGLLVMFAYVAALSPNVLFGSGAPLIFFFMSFFFFLVLMFNFNLVDLPFLSYNMESSKFSFLKTYGSEMVSPQMISILIGLAIILLINLIVVVKICYYTHTSLRPFST